MAIKKFKKIEIIGLKSEERKVIKDLVKLGVVHIDKNILVKDFIEKNSIDEVLEKLYKIYNNVKPYNIEPKPAFAGEKVLIKDEDLLNVMPIDEIERLYEEIETYLDKMRQKQIEIHTQNHRIEHIRIINELHYKMEDIKNTNKTQCTVVIINSRDYDKFLEELDKIPFTYTEKTGEYQQKTGVFIVNHNSISEKIETIKKQFETEIYELKNYKGIPRDEIERSLEIIETLSYKIENTKTILSRYIPYLKKIKIAIDHYENEKKKDQLLFSLPSSQKTFHIFGWIPENCTTKSEELFKQYDVLYVKFSDPQKGENVPVDYKNPKTVGFYQLITDMYGRPNYTELDPTIFISLFFTFFFGFCITDAGYGLVITLITGIILLNKKIRKFIGNGISMIYIFFFSGIATIIMGAITGGFFGIPLPEVIARVVPINLAVDNLDKSAIPFLKFAIYLGAFQVGLGFVLNMIKEIKRKNTFYGIMQNLPNVLIIFSGIKIAALIMGSKVNGTLWGSIFLGSMVLNILFSAPEQKGVGRFFMGFYNTFFGFTGMLGDILSYMRLFALGLATGILIFVINTIAGVLVDLLHTPGYILAVIVLIFGHIANILLNALGAFVHSLRLQYVEFFQKFYESGGEKYQPLRNEYKFVIVDNERDIKER